MVNSFFSRRRQVYVRYRPYKYFLPVLSNSFGKQAFIFLFRGCFYYLVLLKNFFFFNFLTPVTPTPVISSCVTSGVAFYGCFSSYRFALANGSSFYFKRFGWGWGLCLPSGLKKNIRLLTMGYLGERSTSSLLRSRYGDIFFSKSRPVVRGSAKNAVDHRNGGKGRSGIRR